MENVKSRRTKKASCREGRLPEANPPSFKLQKDEKTDRGCTRDVVHRPGSSKASGMVHTCSIGVVRRDGGPVVRTSEFYPGLVFLSPFHKRQIDHIGRSILSCIFVSEDQDEDVVVFSGAVISEPFAGKAGGRRMFNRRHRWPAHRRYQAGPDKVNAGPVTACGAFCAWLV